MRALAVARSFGKILSIFLFLSCRVPRAAESEGETLGRADLDYPEVIAESHLARVYDLVTNAIYSELPPLGETRMTWHCSQRVHEATQWRAPEIDAKVAKEFAAFQRHR